MALTFSLLDSLADPTNDVTSYSTTGGATPTANAALIAMVATVRGGGNAPNTPTLTGYGVTWTHRTTFLYDDAGTQRRIDAFSAVASSSPSSGNVTASYGSDTSLRGCHIHVIEAAGADTTTPVVQAVSAPATVGSGTSLAITLASFADATNNGAVVAWSREVNETQTIDAGLTQAANTATADPLNLASGYRVGEQLTFTATNTASGRHGAVALEIAVAAAAGITLEPTTRALTLAENTPTLTLSDHVSLAPTGQALTLTPGTPTLTVSTASQFARPISNNGDTAWSTVPSQTAANVYLNLDESTPSDADFACSPNNPGAGNTLEVNLSSVTDPEVSTGHVVRFRLAQVDEDAGGGPVVDGAGTQVTATVELWANSTPTLIASHTPTNPSGAWVQGSFTLSGAEADAITDYSTLQVRFIPAGGAGNPADRRALGVSWVEMEVPVASSNVTLAPTSRALTLTENTPTLAVSNHRVLEPTTQALALATGTPTLTVSDTVTLAPTTRALALAANTPTLTLSDHRVLQPTTQALALAANTPTLVVGASVLLEPAGATLSLSANTPILVVSANVTLAPASVNLTLVGNTPVVDVTANLALAPPTLALTLATGTPSLAVDNSITLAPTGQALALTAGTPTLSLSDHRRLEPTSQALTLAAGTPTLSLSDTVQLAPTTLALALATGTPTLSIAQTVALAPASATLTLAAGTPTLALSAHVTLAPTLAGLTLSPGTPSLAVGDTVQLVPTGQALTLAGGTPALILSDAVLLTPTGQALALTANVPALAVTANVTLEPAALTLTLATGTPTLPITIDFTQAPAPRTFTVPSVVRAFTVPIPQRAFTVPAAARVFTPTGGNTMSKFIESDGVYLKDPNGVDDATINWATWLAGDTIASSTWTVAAGLTADSDSYSTTAATLWMSGGTAGSTYTATNRITTAAGRTQDRTLIIQVEEQ